MRMKFPGEAIPAVRNLKPPERSTFSCKTAASSGDSGLAHGRVRRRIFLRANSFRRFGRLTLQAVLWMMAGFQRRPVGAVPMNAARIGEAFLSRR